MNIGEAIQEAKEGACIARPAWNGKGMFVYYFGEMTERVAATGEAMRKRDPYLVMRTAQGTHQAGWLASQADLLADDWMVVNEPGWQDAKT